MKLCDSSDKYSILKDYYNDGAEETRLQKDKAHQVEFLTTIKYIDKILKSDDRILEIGAGTGAYSLHYASQGYRVDSLELVQKNIDILNKKIDSNMNINVRQGTALDLRCYEDNTFDVTLLLGPLYHLYNEEDKRKAIEEALRVTKKNGYLYISYITNDSIIIGHCLKKKRILEVAELCDKNYKLKDNPKEIFSVFCVDDFKKLMKDFDCKFVSSVATNGISLTLRDYINELSDEEFKIWLEYHFAICEREDLQGYSSHMLHICKKN